MYIVCVLNMTHSCVSCSRWSEDTYVHPYWIMQAQLVHTSDQAKVQRMRGKYDSFVCVAQPLIRGHIRASILIYARSLPACLINQMYRVCVANMTHLCVLLSLWSENTYVHPYLNMHAACPHVQSNKCIEYVWQTWFIYVCVIIYMIKHAGKLVCHYDSCMHAVRRTAFIRHASTLLQVWGGYHE